MKQKNRGIVSVDSGSSYFKAIFDGKEYCQPALISQMPENTEIADRIRVDDKWMVAGKRAQQQLGADAPRPDTKDDFHGSMRQQIQMMYAFDQLDVVGSFEGLILTLPWSDYYTKKDLIKQMKSRNKFEWISSSREEKKASFSHIYIIPQGTGAFHLFDSEADEKPDSVILADIGSCTTDIIALQWDEDDQEYVYRENLSKSLKSVSTGVFMDGLVDEIFKKRPKRFEVNYHVLDKKIRKNDYTLRDGSTVIDFSEEFEKQKTVFTNLLKESLKAELGQSFTTADLVLLIGGGPVFLENWECQSKTRTYDHMSNVRGQLKMISEVV